MEVRLTVLDARLRKNVDPVILLLVGAIIVVGLTALYSVARDGNLRYVQRQAIFVLVGLPILAVAASADHARLLKIARGLYVGNIALLLFILKFGHEAKGAMRWVSIAGFQFQPSEPAKVIMIICLAAFLAKRRDTIHQPGMLALSLAYVALPAALIFKQPDLATSLVMMSIWLGMVLVSGARLLHLAMVGLVAVTGFTVLWRADVLEDYQKQRVVSFIQPESDAKKSGYHVIQAKIAVGSGQVWGRGFRGGTQQGGRFIPENHTDFVFTVVGEEGGFVASVLVVALYAGLLARGMMVASGTDEMAPRLIAVGVVSMLGFHAIVNIGMTIGIMPVAGVPLPFMSSGGTAMLSNMAAIGLLQGVAMRRVPLVF